MVTVDRTLNDKGAAGRVTARLASRQLLWLSILIVWLALACSLAAPAKAEPIRIKDIMGREVMLKAPARRIVLGAGRHLAVMGLIHRDPASLVVGWRDDFRRDTSNLAAWSEKFPAVADIPVIGGVAGDGLAVETIVSLSPDLVILSLYDAESQATGRSIDMLRQLGIPVLVVDFFSHPLQNSLPSLKMLGQAIGAEERANAFAAFYTTHLERVRSRLASGPLDRPGLFMHVHAGGMPCCSTPGHGVFNEMIELAGGRNVALDRVPGLYGDVSLEQLIVDDPQIYIATGGAHLAARGGLVLGPGIDPEVAQQSFDRLLGSVGIAELTAVREGHAHALWHMFNDSPVHIVMIEKLARIFHPDRFADLDPQETIDAINRDFLAVPMSGVYWLDQ